MSGIIVWEFIVSNVTGGSLSFVQADAYIKQNRHPLAIYTLRTVLGNLIVLLLADTGLYVWCAIEFPENVGWSWLASLSIFPILAMVAWPMSTLLAYFGARFRDLPHGMALVMQAVWFVSPVYFTAAMFRQGGLETLVDYNPVYHVLHILRGPLLEGVWPSIDDFLYPIGTAFVFFVLAALVGRRSEQRVIFYL